MLIEHPQRTPEDAGGKDGQAPHVLTYERVIDDRHLHRPTFRLLAGNHDFGLVQIRPKRREVALLFDGNIDFSNINEAVLGDLPHTLHPGLHLDLTQPENQTGISVTLAYATTSKNSKVQLVEYDLGDKESSKKYYTGLARAKDQDDGIRGIYEAHYHFGHHYTFIAKNATFQPNLNLPNVRLKVPIGIDWRPEVLEWIATHHVHPHKLAGNIDFAESAKVLSNIQHFTDEQEG